jgi:hypothetical protein
MRAHRDADAPSLPGFAYRLVVAAFLACGLLVCWSAIGLTYYTEMGPGPGFFPFWAGALLCLFCAILLVQSMRGHLPKFEADFIPKKGPALQIAVTIAAIAGFALLIEHLGFVLTTLMVLFALLYVHGCRMMPTGLLVALIGSVGVGFAFRHWLGVYLPPAPGGLLHMIGL